MKKILLIFILFTSSCGYQAIYSQQESKELLFSQIILVGDQEVNRRIVNALSIKEDQMSLSSRVLDLNSIFEISETSKNSKGQVNSYRTTLIVKLEIKENEKILKEKRFFQDFTYNNTDNKFDLVEYQSEIRNNLINKIIEDIIIFINIK